MQLHRYLWLAIVIAVLVLSGCSEEPVGPANSAFTEIRGMTIVEWTADGYSTPNARAQIANIDNLGATGLTILVTAYQTNASSNTVRVDQALTPTPQSVSDLFLETQSLSFPPEIMIKLHVDLDNGEWRGTIDPTDPDAWFASYRAFVLSWASFAELLALDRLVVGTELAATLKHETRWRALIADVRSVYRGELVYAASWDESFLVPFWDTLDIVGVNFYAPVSVRDDSHRFEILANWQPWIDRVRQLHKQAGRDILFTEIGYRSVDGAGQHPYDFSRVSAVDFEEQADLYWAALQAIGDKPWIRGLYWWNWLANSNGGAEVDFTPQGKPAEKELLDAWGR